MSLSDKFLDEGAAFWRSHIKQELSREEVRQTAENLRGFFTVLRDWAVADEQEKEGRGFEGNAGSEFANDLVRKPAGAISD